jgi:hypothetical protein
VSEAAVAAAAATEFAPRAAAVAACLTSLRATLALPPRVMQQLEGVAVSHAWEGVQDAAAMCEAVRELCPALAGRSDVGLQHALLDILADLNVAEASEC